MHQLPSKRLQATRVALDPMVGCRDLATFLPAFADIDLSELACFLGAQPDEAAVRRLWCEDQELQLWQAPVPQLAQPVLAAYCTATGQPYISVYFCDPEAPHKLGLHAYLELYGDIVDTLSRSFFGSQAGLDTLFSQTRIPTADPLYALYLDLGWEQWSTQLLQREPYRFLFGLRRAAFDAFAKDVDVEFR